MRALSRFPLPGSLISRAGATRRPSRSGSASDYLRDFPSFPSHLFTAQPSASSSPSFSPGTSPQPPHFDGFLPTPSTTAPPTGSSIDWTHCYALERARKARLASLPGLHGVVSRMWDAGRPWVAVVLVGVLTGAVASGLDVLSGWLSDLRMGKCTDMWWMSRGLCCAGLERASSVFSLALVSWWLASERRTDELCVPSGGAVQGVEDVGRDCGQGGSRRRSSPRPVRRLHGHSGALRNHHLDQAPRSARD